MDNQIKFDEDSKLIFLQRLDGFDFGSNLSPEIEEELILQPIKLLIWNQFPKYFRACLQLLSIYVCLFSELYLSCKPM